MQLGLLTAAVPRDEAGITIHLGDVSLALAARGARLVIADPPWEYFHSELPREDNRPDVMIPYETTTNEAIVRTLDRSWDCVGESGYLLCWMTWPKLIEFLGVVLAGPLRWRYVSGGAWTKTTGRGIGYHLRGDSEPFLLFVKGAPGKPLEALGNAPASPRGAHSEKPVAFLEDVMRAFTSPGDLVVSLYSGRCPEARAAKRTGRRLIGAEIDPERHALARVLLAQERKGS